MTKNIVPRLRRGELVADGAGNICVVRAQVHDKVWTYCNPKALDAADLRGADAGFPGVLDQYPKEAREPLL